MIYIQSWNTNEVYYGEVSRATWSAGLVNIFYMDNLNMKYTLLVHELSPCFVFFKSGTCFSPKATPFLTKSNSTASWHLSRWGPHWAPWWDTGGRTYLGRGTHNGLEAVARSGCWDPKMVVDPSILNSQVETFEAKPPWNDVKSTAKLAPGFHETGGRPITSKNSSQKC